MCGWTPWTWQWLVATGGWLTDKHMEAAMKLVKENFSEIKGLQSTLQTSSFGNRRDGSVQIQNCGAHWLTSSRIDGRVCLCMTRCGVALWLKDCKRLLWWLDWLEQSTGSRNCSSNPTAGQFRLWSPRPFAIVYLFHLAMGDELQNLLRAI